MPFETATACSTPQAAATSSSSSCTFGPIVSAPDSKTRAHLRQLLLPKLWEG